jgi:hypothetical protein
VLDTSRRLLAIELSRPIDLVDDHDVDQSLFDVGQQLLDRAGKAAVVIWGLAQSPAFPC